MGIWIRTQSKGVLAKCNDFSIQEDVDNNLFKIECGEISADMSYTGGKYSSKEKAHKVLDMIEAYIFWNERGNVKKPFQFPTDAEV